MKNKLGWLMILTMVFFIGMPAQAENFTNFTLTSTSLAVDYKANGGIAYVTKNGGASYENCFYVTPTSFSQMGSANFRSVQKDNSSIRTSWVNVSKGGVNVTRSSYYIETAPSGVKYKLQGKRGTVSSGSSITVSGRWTP